MYRCKFILEDTARKSPIDNVYLQIRKPNTQIHFDSFIFQFINKYQAVAVILYKTRIPFFDRIRFPNSLMRFINWTNTPTGSIMKIECAAAANFVHIL